MTVYLRGSNDSRKLYSNGKRYERINDSVRLAQQAVAKPVGVTASRKALGNPFKGTGQSDC